MGSDPAPDAWRGRGGWYFGPFLDPPSWIAAKDAIVDGE